MKYTIILLVTAASAAVLLSGCASTNGPVNTCTCQDTTLRYDRQLTAERGSPLAQASVGFRRVHRIGSDSLYSDVFGGAETQAGVGGTTVSLGTMSVGSLQIEPSTQSGVTQYGFRGGVDDLPIDKTADVGFAGNASAGIAPFAMPLYVGEPLDVKYYGLDGSDVPDTLDASQDLVLTWTPGGLQPAIMRIVVEMRNNSGITISQQDFSGPDDGKRVIPEEALLESQVGSLIVVVLTQRVFTKCSCQPAMQYNMASWSEQYLFRMLK